MVRNKTRKSPIRGPGPIRPPPPSSSKPQPSPPPVSPCFIQPLFLTKTIDGRVRVPRTLCSKVQTPRDTTNIFPEYTSSIRPPPPPPPPPPLPLPPSPPSKTPRSSSGPSSRDDAGSTLFFLVLLPLRTPSSSLAARLRSSWRGPPRPADRLHPKGSCDREDWRR